MAAVRIASIFGFILVLSMFLITPCLGASPDETPEQVWTVNGRQWSVEDEYQYAKWVETNISEDFFIRHQIPVDCADVPYAARWIYSRMAHLPAAATTYDGRFVGHWSTEWKHLPDDAEWHEDPRFRAALLNVLSETSTRTLPLDTYPIRITQESVTPGTTLLSGSHAGIIGRISLDGSYAHPLQTWEATLPVRIQKMRQNTFFIPQPESATYSGVLKFRWPILAKGGWRYLPVEAHPFYSEEQYGSEFCKRYGDFAEAVSKRLDPTEYDPWERTDKVMRAVTRYLQERVPIVLAGYERCRKGGCSEGSGLWEIYSTPARDEMIASMMGHLTQLIETNCLDRENIKGKMESIVLPISQDRSATFYQIYQNRLWLSPHPEDSIEARWGLKKCDLILPRIRDARESILFIETTYREKDPQYADFAVRQQQEIIRGLAAELDRSPCDDTEERKHVGDKGF
jgi:hypothetical protein